MQRRGLSLAIYVTNPNIRPAAARAFIRSLNILLKFARMYDFGHPRTKKQYETAWSELRTALGTGTESEAGVLLAVSGDQLLLDGTLSRIAPPREKVSRCVTPPRASPAFTLRPKLPKPAWPASCVVFPPVPAQSPCNSPSN